MTDNWFEIKNRKALSKLPPDTDREQWKKFRNALDKTERLERIENPLQIDVELNGGCNMKCPFCIHAFDDIPNATMPIIDYKYLIREAISMGVQSVKLNYINEPFLRRDLEEIIEWTRAQGIVNIYVVTNGTALTWPRRARLIESGLTKLFVSIDATTPEIYEQQRLSKQYEKVVGNVLAFIIERNRAGKSHPLVCVNFLVNKINEHQKNEFGRFWNNVADVVSFQRMNEVPDQETGLTVDHSEPARGCKFPFKQMVIDHRGNVLPCCKLAAQKLKLGNIFDGTTLREAWTKMEPLRVMHERNEWHEHPVCGPCMRCEG